MKAKQTIRGWWWLPEQPDKKVPGIAEIVRGKGATLQLLEVLPFTRNGYVPVHGIPMILGESIDGREFISLLDGYETTVSIRKYALPPDGYSHATIVARCAIVGVHLASPSVPARSVSVGFTYLNRWVNDYSSILHEYDSGVIQIVGEIGKEKVHASSDLNNGFKLELIGIVHPDDDFFNGKYGLAANAYFRICHEEGALISDYRTLVVGLQNFLILATQRKVFATDIHVNFGGDSDGVIMAKDNRGSASVYLYHRCQRIDKERFVDTGTMLFVLPQIGDSCSTILRNWLNEAPLFDLAYHLYFAVALEKNLYAENKFLSYIQAIEGYHRRVVDDDKYVPKAEFKSIVESVIAAIPEGVSSPLKASIVQSIQRANDYSLRERLEWVLARRGSILKQTFFGNDEQCTRFVRSVVETRNYLSHILDPSKMKNVLSIENSDFGDAIERLQILLESCLLDVCGMGGEMIDTILMGRYDRRIVRNKVVKGSS